MPKKTANKPDIRISAETYNAQSPCRHCWVDLPDGRTVAFFVNLNTGLVVVDVVDASGKAGNEVFCRCV